MLRHSILALATVAGLAVVGAQAADLTIAQAAAPTFESLDKNSDGKVSLDEASANDPLFTAFKTLDANKDGTLTKEEFSSYRPSTAS
jgi:Ca2+-binding EF-hand superfamily protein